MINSGNSDMAARAERGREVSDKGAGGRGAQLCDAGQSFLGTSDLPTAAAAGPLVSDHLSKTVCRRARTRPPFQSGVNSGNAASTAGNAA